jgi:hypothetical protein
MVMEIIHNYENYAKFLIMDLLILKPLINSILMLVQDHFLLLFKNQTPFMTLNIIQTF